jgi:hypothetical protein
LAKASLTDIVNENAICMFFNNQPGAHDSEKDAGSSGDHGAGKGAAIGAASGGLVAGTIATLAGGPVAGAVGAAVGAYTSSLAGAGEGLPEEGENTNNAPPPRAAGMILAVRIDRANDAQEVIECLRQFGAADIEKAEGTWENGEWADFDPVLPPQLI